MSFNNQTIWITGASSGFGEALAIALAGQGASLILSSRRADALEGVRQRCANPDKHKVIPLDLADQADFDSVVEQALAFTGRVDVLVNNGGISQRSAASDTTDQVYRAIREVDFCGQIALTRRLIPHWSARQSGYIVNICSVAGKFGAPQRTGYCAAKHALLGFMDALRIELYSDNIQVSNIGPGFVQTNIDKNALTGKGELAGVDDPNISGGIPLQEFVGDMLKVMQKRQPEWVEARGKVRFAYHLHRLMPNVFLRVINKLAA